MPPRAKVPPIGSISEGTLNSIDLLSAFADALEEYGTGAPHIELVNEARDLLEEFDAADDGETDAIDTEAALIVDAMQDALGEVAPPYCLFGTHAGDGADFGFWPQVESAQEDDDVLKVEDTSEVPKGYTGFVLHVNDHGNATLYDYTRGRSREVWSVV